MYQGLNLDRQETLEELARWVLENREDIHALGCKYYYITVSTDLKTITHEKCTCGLDDILDRLNG